MDYVIIRDGTLNVATILSFAANEEQDAVGAIPDESFEVSAMDSNAKEFLSSAIDDYNAVFKTNFGVDSNGRGGRVMSDHLSRWIA